MHFCQGVPGADHITVRAQPPVLAHKRAADPVELPLPACGRAIAFGSDARVARDAATSLPVIPAEGDGLRPASESRNPAIKVLRAFTPAVDYWVPARASPVEPGSLGRDDGTYVIALLHSNGRVVV